MKAVLATDLSAASEATIENETCLNCLGRIGVDEIHLVTVIPSNVHAGMPGIDFEKRRRRSISKYEHVIENAGFDVEFTSFVARLIDAFAVSSKRSVLASPLWGRGERVRSRIG